MADSIEDAVGRMIAGGGRATNQIAEHLLGQAQREAPIEFGTLRGSGFVVYLVNGAEHADFGEAIAAAVAMARAGNLRSFVAEIRFPLVYAARQHEETTWRHPRGGKAKYLEDPLKENAPRYEGALSAAIRPQF